MILKIWPDWYKIQWNYDALILAITLLLIPSKIISIISWQLIHTARLHWTCHHIKLKFTLYEMFAKSGRIYIYLLITIKFHLEFQFIPVYWNF